MLFPLHEVVCVWNQQNSMLCELHLGLLHGLLTSTAAAAARHKVCMTAFRLIQLDIIHWADH